MMEDKGQCEVSFMTWPVQNLTGNYLFELVHNWVNTFYKASMSGLERASNIL